MNRVGGRIQCKKHTAEIASISILALTFLNLLVSPVSRHCHCCVRVNEDVFFSIRCRIIEMSLTDDMIQTFVFSHTVPPDNDRI